MLPEATLPPPLAVEPVADPSAAEEIAVVEIVVEVDPEVLAVPGNNYFT